MHSYDAWGDAIGLPTNVTSPAGSDDFRYDAAGRVRWQGQSFTVAGGPTDQRTVTTTYNALGSVSQQVLGDGTNVAYDYDRRGMLQGANAVGRRLFSQVRNPAGLVTARTLNPDRTSHTSEWSYDALGRLRDMRVRARPFPLLPPRTIAQQTHAYYSSGDVRSVGETIDASTRAFAFTYDHQSQIRSAADNRGYQAAYDYTPAGRLLSVDLDLAAGADTPSRDVIYDYDETDPERLRALLDRQTGADVVRLSHDPGGNVVGKVSNAGSWTHRYDAAGNVRISSRGSERELYFYDTGGRRVLALRKANGAVVGTRRWFDTLEVETAQGVTTTRATISAGLPVARVTNGALHYLHHNATGNLLIATREDGAIEAGFSYGAFGEVLQMAGQATQFKRRYQDNEKDSLTGWYDYGVRLYDPETMLWNRSDPLYRFVPEYAGVEPRRLALYTFSLNNPLRYVDADGRDPYESQQSDVPPWVASAQRSMDAGEALADGVMAVGELVPAVYAMLKQYDLMGITDVPEMIYYLTDGQYEAAAKIGVEVAAGVALGWGIGKVAMRAGKVLGRMARGADEVADMVDDGARFVDGFGDDFARASGDDVAGAAGRDVAGAECAGGACSCFVAGTAVRVGDGRLPIEDVRVGMRLPPDSSECQETSFDGLFAVRLQMATDEGDSFDITLLRGRTWMEATGARPGVAIWVDLTELGVAGPAQVVTVDESVVVPDGPGCPATGTVLHTASSLVSLRLEDSNTPIEVTPQHPIFSFDRDGWVAAADLQLGERVVTETSTATVASVGAYSTPSTAVYNLEVFGVHRYYVHADGVLVHNTCGAEGEAPKLLAQGAYRAEQFASQKLFDGHFAKHGAEWGAGNITKTGYLKRAQDLLGRDVGDGILGSMRANGDVLRYNVRTNEFAVGTADGFIRTLFRPEKGMEYWLKQVGT